MWRHRVWAKIAFWKHIVWSYVASGWHAVGRSAASCRKALKRLTLLRWGRGLCHSWRWCHALLPLVHLVNLFLEVVGMDFGRREPRACTSCDDDDDMKGRDRIGRQSRNCGEV